MKQRNRRPRMNQGMFDPRIKKEKETKYFEPASTYALLNMAGGNYDMTRDSPMDVMTALATRVFLKTLLHIFICNLYDFQHKYVGFKNKEKASRRCCERGFNAEKGIQFLPGVCGCYHQRRLYQF